MEGKGRGREGVRASDDGGKKDKMKRKKNAKAVLKYPVLVQK